MVIMKNLLYLLFMISFSVMYSQEVTKREYEIYGKVIGEQGYQFYPINLGIPSKFKLGIDDSIYSKIERMQIRQFDQKKLLEVALKYSINKTFKIVEGDQYNQIFFSPIYFKNQDEAYFIYILKSNREKPYS